MMTDSFGIYDIMGKVEVISDASYIVIKLIEFYHCKNGHSWLFELDPDTINIIYADTSTVKIQDRNDSVYCTVHLNYSTPIKIINKICAGLGVPYEIRLLCQAEKD